MKRRRAKFRIVTAQDDHLVSANMRLCGYAGEGHLRAYGHAHLSRAPDVELWVLCRPEAAYFLWRHWQRQPKQEGQLRSDVCAVAAFLRIAARRTPPFSAAPAAPLPAAVKASGVRALTCICPDRATARLIENKVSGTRAYEGSSGYTDLADASQSAVLMYLPVKAEKTERLESDLRNALFETAPRA